MRIVPVIQFQPSEVAKVAVILYFCHPPVQAEHGEKEEVRAAAPSPAGCWSVLDRIGFLELVPYGAILMVIARC